ncbi:hypothetical protein SAMN04490240_1394 [Rhodococcus pyridinivorans]|nr:hypothetical protein RDE2_40460 [Rhodococcus sp. RDE2]SEC26236.1 hypothetical protein SAMN04490240_1394 [Rhodococcus pyridinivorans]
MVSELRESSSQIGFPSRTRRKLGHLRGERLSDVTDIVLTVLVERRRELTFVAGTNDQTEDHSDGDG